MADLNTACVHDVSDDDCYKCLKKGIIFRCPYKCEDFKGVWENEERDVRHKMPKVQ